MSFLNANFPTLRVYVRNRFLHDGTPNQDRPPLIEGDVVGVKSLQGRALGFHVLLRDGACFWNLPAHALAWHADADPGGNHSLSDLQLWDCFSYDLAVTTFDRLGVRVEARIDGGWAGGRYFTTIDWCAPDPGRIDTTFAELPEEHKCGHVILLDDGDIAVLPNNRLRFVDQSFTTERLNPTYKTQTTEWGCENGSERRAEDTDRVFYDIEKTMEGG